MINHYKKLCSCIDVIIANNLTKFDTVDTNRQPNTANFTVSPLMLTASYNLDVALKDIITTVNEIAQHYNENLKISKARQLKKALPVIEAMSREYYKYDDFKRLVKFWCGRLSKAIGYGSYIHSFCPEHPDCQVVKIYGKGKSEYFCGDCDGYYTHEEYQKKIIKFLKNYQTQKTIYVTTNTLKRLLSVERYKAFRYLQRKGLIKKCANGYDLAEVNIKTLSKINLR